VSRQEYDGSEPEDASRFLIGLVTAVIVAADAFIAEGPVPNQQSVRWL
jgi:hypothetical protein